MVNLSCVGLTETIKAITNITTSLEARFKALLEVLMTEGYDIASAGFDPLTAVYAGTNDVIVSTPTWDGDRLILSADGNAVAFIEFGTGTYYEDYPDAEMVARVGAVQHGEYKKKKGAHPPWVYVGKDAGNAGFIKHKKPDGTFVIETLGNPPARAMYNASKVFDKEHIVTVAREVFHD